MRHIRTKMIAMIALPTLLIYVVVLGITMLHLRKQARDDVDREMVRLANQLAGRFDGAFREAAAIAVTTARSMEIAPLTDRKKIEDFLAADTLENPAVYGAAMAFEPPAPDGGADLFCPYVYRGA